MRARNDNGWGRRSAWAVAAALVALPAIAQSPAPPPAQNGDLPQVVAPPPAPPDDQAAKPQPKKAPLHPPNRAVPLDIDVISQKVARYPNNAYLLNELGNLLLKKGRRPEAQERYEQAVEIDEKFAAAWNNLGVVRASRGLPEGAEHAYRKAIEIQPNYALAWYNLGVSLDAQGMYDDAIEAYEQAFILDRNLLDVKHNPQVITNRRLAAVACQYYMDMGGTVTYPIESSYQPK